MFFALTRDFAQLTVTLGNRYVELQSVNHAGNELRKLLIRKDFSVNTAAEAHSGCEDMDFLHFSGHRIG